LRPGTRQGYRKFRIRQSIDFPIVSLASVFVMNGDEIEDARLVIGAAAPVPLRLVPVEDFLKGKKISEQMAGEAAEIAVRQATPLRKNDYKIKVTKALVRDAVFELL
jgi:CO/xanthine dehydrogenase FAD-binding subunit